MDRWTVEIKGYSIQKKFEEKVYFDWMDIEIKQIEKTTKMTESIK